MSSESPRDRLPFEPQQTKKKTPKQSPVANPTVETPVASKTRRSAKDEASLSRIPDAVSNRMLRRMAFFSGIPTAMGIGSFVISYYVGVNELIELPPVAVLLVSLGCFGLGVVGLSYGILSSSWDEDRVGNLLGSEEFKLNFGRMRQAWKAGRQESRSKS